MAQHRMHVMLGGAARSIGMRLPIAAATIATYNQANDYPGQTLDGEVAVWAARSSFR